MRPFTWNAIARASLGRQYLKFAIQLPIISEWISLIWTELTRLEVFGGKVIPDRIHFATAARSRFSMNSDGDTSTPRSPKLPVTAVQIPMLEQWPKNLSALACGAAANLTVAVALLFASDVPDMNQTCLWESDSDTFQDSTSIAIAPSFLDSNGDIRAVRIDAHQNS